ncbi:MAG: sugar ABC transporter substrate-binding protein [Anaerolineae bacterium]|nr:sugar ABC transporter substrate-binding protein [Anaerolineae bacterium]
MESAKMYSRRRALKIGVGMLGLGGLAACAPAATPQVVEREVTVIVQGTPQIVKETVVVPAAAGPVKIRWAVKTWDEMRMKVIDDCAQEVMKLDPGIEVVVEPRPGQGYWEKLQTEFAGGVAPDVTYNQMNWVIPGAARGMFLDIKPFMERDNWTLEDYWYPMDLEWEWQGGLYGTLMVANGQTLCISTTLMEQAGLDLPDEDWTWDDLLTYAKAMTDKEAGQWGLLGANSAPPYWLCAFIHGAGGSVLNEDYNKCTITDPVAMEAIQWVADLMFTHEVLPTPALLEGMESPFLTGKAGMSFELVTAASTIRPTFEEQGFGWQYVHMPRHPVTGLRSVQMGSNVWSIIANTQFRDQAWTLCKYLGDVEGQKRWMLFGLPGQRSLIASDEFLSMWGDQDITIPIADLDCCGHDYYPTSDCGEWWGLMNQELSVIWTGEATVEEACRRACEKCDEVFARRPPHYEKNPQVS